MIDATKNGRNLVLTMEGVDPFVIRPLPGHAGRQITDTYLSSVAGGSTTIDLTAALQMAVDGAVLEGDVWVPRPESEQTNFNRIGMELSQDEAELIIMPAFFWQTILGMDGVKAYIQGGEGLAGTLKASGALTARLGLLARRTSPSSE
ncbi:hypothetical protein MicroSTF_14510 [Microbacterium sp. STF-2]|uniref:hypothetical protein n=1 Tax=Microbacterium sp. STF-2 TaxID=3031132 RepID=UPI002AFFB75F|nr:hypothetical protein [Microbacterium sp. STF-2]MEA1264252.1 hypothetical protein [Microbacterium sp. STF-2]